MGARDFHPVDPRGYPGDRLVCLFEEAAPMNGYGMNQKRSLFVIGGIIALLGFLIVVLIVTKTPEEVLSTSSEIPETVDLTNHKIGDLESLTVENGEGSYTIRPTEPGVESYYVEELKDLPCNHDAVKYAVQGVMNPAINKEVGVVDDLEEFGLASPSATVTLRFDDGSSVVCLIGDQAPSDEETRYLSLKGSSYVYIVGVDHYLLRSAAAYADLTVVEAPQEEGNDTAQYTFGDISFWGSSFPQKIVLRAQGDGSFQMTEPIASACDESMISYITTALKGLTAQSAATVFPDETALQTYGLSSPQAAVQYTVNGEAVTLYASSKDDDTVYLMRDGRNIVYQVSLEDVDMWFTTSRYLLREKSVVSLTADDTQSVAIVSGEQSLSLTLSREKDEEKSTENTDYYQYTVTNSRGEDVGYARYSRLLEDLSALRLSGDTEEVPQGNPTLSFTYQGFTDTDQHSLSFLQRDDGQWFLMTDGQVTGLVDDADMQNIQRETDKLIEAAQPFELE